MLKSIVEEASSIAKAIEKAWQSAGRPSEFTVKVFEQPERSFFGFTKKPAKVGLFFSGRQVQPQRDRREARRGERDRRDAGQERSRESRPSEGRGAWSQETVSFAADWLEGALRALGLDQSVSSSTRGNTLLFCLSSSVSADKREERVLLSGFAHLIMESLRCKYGQRSMGDLKVNVDAGQSGHCRRDSGR